MEPITVIIPTYNRPEIVFHTVLNLRLELGYAGPVRIYISADGEGDFEAISKLFRDGTLPLSPETQTLWEGPRRGLGANLNFLMSKVETDIVLQMDDDHHLVRHLDISQFVKDLRNPDKCVDWIRLMVGEEKDVESLSTYYKFRAVTYGRYWMLDPNGRELYLTSNRPHLKRLDFHWKVGWYPENAKLGETETLFCHQYIDYMRQNGSGRPSVAIPMELPPFGTWAHVGESWQKHGL